MNNLTVWLGVGAAVISLVAAILSLWAARIAAAVVLSTRNEQEASGCLFFGRSGISQRIGK